MVTTYFASSELAGTCVSGAGWVSSAAGGVLASVPDVSVSASGAAWSGASSSEVFAVVWAPGASVKVTLPTCLETLMS